MDSSIPDSWDTAYDSDGEESKFTTLPSNLIQKISEMTLEELQEFEETFGISGNDDFIRPYEDEDFENNGSNNNSRNEELPLIIVNFTKWSNGKIKFNVEKQFIDSEELFLNLLKSLNDEDVFTRVTDDLLEKDIGFHSTSVNWKDDIKILENKYKGDFFQAISYPKFLGGFLTNEIWKKIKEKTEWNSVNILKCIYLAKTNRPLLYKHNMALSLEFMALEQKLLGQTAKRLKQEEELEEAKIQEQYQQRLQKKYEDENNNRILKSLSQQIFSAEGVQLPFSHEEGEKENNRDEREENSGDEEMDEDNEDEEKNREDEEEEEEEDDGSYHSEDEEADNELEFGDQRKKYQKEQIEKEKIKELEIAKARREKENDKPPQPIMNVLDQVIAIVFSKILIEDDNEKANHYQYLNRIHQSIRETWAEEFGCLPPNCLWREDISDH